MSSHERGEMGGVIRLHKAQVSVDSRPGEGTRIELDFPLNS